MQEGLRPVTSTASGTKGWVWARPSGSLSLGLSSGHLVWFTSGACWTLCGMETDRCHLHTLSPPCFSRRGAGGPSFYFPGSSRFPATLEHQYLLVQLWHRSAASIFVAATSDTSQWPHSGGQWDFLLQAPQNWNRQRKSYSNCQPPRAQPEAVDRSLVFLSKNPICLSWGFWFDANLEAYRCQIILQSSWHNCYMLC